LCISSALEPPISDFESQLERLNVALQRWQQAEQQLQPLEDRLWDLSSRGSDVLNKLAAADERQAHAVSEVEARLSEWHATERRLHQDSLDRIRVLERTIEQEWRALRGLHEEPLRLLREQAAALGETSVAAASLSLRGYERAEARLSALESDLRAQLSQLSRDIHAALAEVKAAAVGAPATLPAPAAPPFPLDRVMRIHDELRASGGKTAAPAAEPAPAAPAAPTAGGVPDEARQLPSAALSKRVEELERELTQEKQDIEDTTATTRRLRRTWRLAAIAGVAAVAGLVVLGMLGLQLQQALDEASRRVTAAEQQALEADREIASARAETVAARDSAARAEMLSSVLAAPDLLRFSLVGVGESRGSRGQVMWSRSNGIVVSASALPAPPSGSEYYVWLLSPSQPTRVGKLTPDVTGRATLVTTAPDAPRPVDGVAVTVESIGSTSPVPAGLTVLARPPAVGP
jgi:hypothetical protein